MNKPISSIKKGRKFDQVLDGARTVFMRNGFEATGVDDIAREAGVSKATLYSYFPDKRMLFIEAASRECLRVTQGHLETADLTRPPSEVLPEAGRKILKFLLSDVGQNIFRIGVTESGRFPELARKFYESGPKLMRDTLGLYLRAATERGELVINDVDLAAEQFAELCKVHLHPCCLLGLKEQPTEAEIDRVIDGAVDMFLARYGV
ncbi:TetR/AcrR family transcriptional regulator [Aliiroseovarius sp. PTFE2010]|uniref:TetR/AcrR family transcriptional regulator n=1 Tax=Aliiroseovarius sp. PTFE2010 TaxID=3417190 RepID=UPI003CEE1CBE